MEIIKQNENLLISAKEIHRLLGMKKDFSAWFKDNAKKSFLSIEKDFTPQKGISSGGRPSIDYLLTKDSAIAFILISGGENARQLRDHVIKLFNKSETGLLFSHEQINALMDLSKSLTLISLQKEVEKKHFAVYNQPENWWSYRAALLGYSTCILKERMREINHKWKNQREALLKLDGAELIRTGAIDLMKSLGKTDEYATNVGQLCKDMAEKMNLSADIWDDVKSNPLKLNQASINERTIMFNNSQKRLK